MIQAPGVDLIILFGVNLLTLYCRLDLFIEMQQILLMYIKWSSLHKIVIKFTPKRFYEINLWGLYHKTYYSRNLRTP
jgi:hypothetical protein